MYNNLPLNSDQLDTLKDDFVALQIDNMDMQCLIELASDYLYNSYDRLTQTDMKERIECLYSEETYLEISEKKKAERKQKDSEKWARVR